MSIPPKIDEKLLTTFGTLMRASARKKVYSHKAKKEGDLQTALLLRAIASSEAIQARRILNLIKGHIDLSEVYLQTIFEDEVGSLIERYDQDIELISQSGIPSIPEAMTQLRAAERRIKSFYTKNSQKFRSTDNETLYVCNFCGYISVDHIPETCPICSAEKKAFIKVE